MALDGQYWYVVYQDYYTTIDADTGLTVVLPGTAYTFYVDDLSGMPGAPRDNALPNEHDGPIIFSNSDGSWYDYVVSYIPSAPGGSGDFPVFDTYRDAAAYYSLEVSDYEEVALFTLGSDKVDFNALTASQSAAVASHYELYQALDGDDQVTLPNVAHYSALGWDGTQTFSAGAGNDTIHGGDGNDKIDGGSGADHLFGEGGTDVFTIGDPLVEAGDTISGGDGYDTILMTGRRDQVAGYTVQFGSSWAATTTTLTFANGASTEVTDTVERIIFTDATLMNDVKLSSNNIIAEMAQLSLEAYNDSAEASAKRANWRPLSAMELGIRAGNFIGATGQYTFTEGVFDVSTSATAHGDVEVLVGLVNRKATLALAFRGTDEFADIGTYFPFSQNYSYFSPLITAVKEYISYYGIQQVFITGHSLGAALAQTALGESFAGTVGVESFDFASPGSDVSAPGNLITTFDRELDPVPLLGSVLNSVSGSVITIGGTDDWSPHPHSIAAYCNDIQQLIGMALDPNNVGFHASSFAAALSAGSLWTAGSEVVRLGRSSNDSLRSGFSDNFVLAGGGSDRIEINGGSPSRLTDGGSGTDKVYFSDLGNYARSAVSGGFEIFQDGSSVGKFYDVEFFFDHNGPLWNTGPVQHPAAQAAALGDSTTTVTFTLLPGYTAADAGDGAMAVVGTSDDDVIYAGVGNKSINAGAGNDMVIIRDSGTFGAADTIRIDGGTGADLMIGGTGSETFIVDNLHDGVDDAGGVDLILSSVSYVLPDSIENITLQGTAIGATGNALANVIRGNAEANILDGGSGADALSGGAGDDTYIVDNAHDRAYEGVDAGIDTVQASASYVLGVNVENLTLVGADPIRGTGNDLANVIRGNGAANVINGAAGADKLYGGAGDDIFYVDDTHDLVYENAGEGVDRVISSVSYALRANLEQLTLAGSADIYGRGNDLGNVISGNAGANALYGYGGNDKLYGGAGADVLVGGLGNDALTGGTENDKLYGGDGADVISGGDGNDWLEGGGARDRFYGGAGADNFVFRDGDFGGVSTSTCDQIHDFSEAGGDHVRLSLVDADTTIGGDQAFSFVGTTAFSHTAGELRYEQISGNTYIEGDTNGDGVADFMIRLDGLHGLIGTNFVL
jgi:Ca2+-binding RTX toxin-like protein